MVENSKEKALIRKEKLVLRNTLLDDKRQLWDQKILMALLESPIYRECQVLLVYSSYQKEADTHSLILRALEDKKQVFCPKVHGEDMEFYRIWSIEDLKDGYMGIKEPLPNTEASFKASYSYYKDKNYVLIILPLVAFNGHCQRIGYGKGYYDRYLSSLLCPFRTIGIAYDIQYEADFVSDSYDYPLEYIITEKQIYKNGGIHSWNI